MRAGIAHQQAGRLEEARRCYETALALQPDALHLLGLVRHRQGASDEAIAAVRRAVALVPRHPDFQFNLALMLRFADRLIAHLRRVDIVGVAGTTGLAAPVWTRAGWPALHGIVAHGEPDGGRCAVSFYGPAAPPGAPVQALDGLFIAMRRTVLDSVRFDAATFDGFHFYDIDFTYAAHPAGCAIGVATDIALLHHSPGRADASYAVYAERFRAKYRDRLPTDPGPQSPRLEIRVEVASRGDAATLCRRLGEAPPAPVQQ